MRFTARRKKRGFGGWEVYDAESNLHLGWVVKIEDEWFAYKAPTSISIDQTKGRKVGTFATMREAIDEVLIEASSF